MTTNELIYETKADSQTQRTDLRLPKGKGWCMGDGLRVWDRQMPTTT